MTEPVSAQQAFRSALAIEVADSLAAIKDEVRAFAGPLGYDRFVLFSASATQDEVVERIYWVEGDWFGGGESVDAETYVRRCPVTRHILEAREPFFWTKTMAKEGELYNIVRHPRGQGIHGLQVPVFGPLGLEGAMSLGGQRIDASHQARLVLALIAATAFFSAHKLLDLCRIANGKCWPGPPRADDRLRLRQRWAFPNGQWKITCGEFANVWALRRLRRRSG